MIRFYNSNIYSVECDALNKNELYAYFQNGHQREVVCVLISGVYMGSITYTSLQENEDIHKSIQQEYLILDETIWQKGREFFAGCKVADVVPVLNKRHQLVGLAWQDEEANRELRMLRELEECRDALSFRDFYPDCTGVTVHGCNELAWYFVKYLSGCGIDIRVDGEFWQELGTWEDYGIAKCENYEIWAEGVHRKSKSWKQERLRSASVEFECVDKIYEANIKAGKITDADGNVEDLLERLRKEKEIVIRGTGTKALDAYDWLLANGIDICAFQPGKMNETRKSLFGKPIVGKEIAEQFQKAVIIECGSKYSAWGFGNVDTYAYEGYERNKRYLLLRDYIEILGNNLVHILAGKKLIFTGDIRLCNRVYRWYKQHVAGIGRIEYWDILGENGIERARFEIPEADGSEMAQGNVYLLIAPRYAYKGHVSKEAADKYGIYIDQFKTYEIHDYIDYFSDMKKSIHLEYGIKKYGRKELCPHGILLGAIAPYCGNTLVRQSLEGHSHIIMLEEYGYFNDDLYSVCIRLSEEKSEDILSAFWTLYEKEAGADVIPYYFPDIERFDHKMEELLRLSDYFTSQELFVMFHVAYEAMHGREKLNLGDIVIYWEPHQWNPEMVREWAYWLGSTEVNGFTLSMVRNQYIRAGSVMRSFTELSWRALNNCMYGWDMQQVRVYEYWNEWTVKFEEFKCKPKETLLLFCEWLGIPFNDALMETTMHRKKAFYGEITGFEIKPAYNLYEEYFTVFDRMRICLTARSYQKKYGYPYENCLDFSRQELQEMFLKDFHWEKISGATEGKDEESIWKQQKIIRYLLWLARFAEIMEIEIVEKY